MKDLDIIVKGWKNHYESLYNKDFDLDKVLKPTGEVSRRIIYKILASANFIHLNTHSRPNMCLMNDKFFELYLKNSEYVTDTDSKEYACIFNDIIIRTSPNIESDMICVYNNKLDENDYRNYYTFNVITYIL